MNKLRDHALKYDFSVRIPGLENFFVVNVKKETLLGTFKISILQKVALKILQGGNFREDWGGKKECKTFLEKEKITFLCHSQKMEKDNITLETFVKNNGLKKFTDNLKLFLV